MTLFILSILVRQKDAEPLHLPKAQLQKYIYRNDIGGHRKAHVNFHTQMYENHSIDKPLNPIKWQEVNSIVGKPWIP